MTSTKMPRRRRTPALAAALALSILTPFVAAPTPAGADQYGDEYEEWYRGPGNSNSLGTLMGLWGQSDIVILVRRSEEPSPVVGWSQTPMHPGAHAVYVAAGDSLADAYAQIIDGKGDHLLLERGGVWREPLPRWNKSGRSARHPLVIGAYGEGPRPIIIDRFPFYTAPGTTPLNHIAIIGLHLRAPSDWNGQSGDAVGIWFQRTGNGLLIEDCLIEGFANNISIEGMQPNGRSNFQLRRCILADPFRVDSGNTNLFVSSVNGFLIEENALINTMANEARGAKHSHGMYLSASNTPGAGVVRGNIVYNARTNITLRGGGVIEDNLSIRGGQGITTSPSDLGPAHGVITGNVVSESRNHWNGQHLGLGIEARNIETYIDDNIIFGATDGSSHVGITLSNTGGAVRGNIVHAWSKKGEGLLSPALVVNAIAPIEVAMNRLVQTEDQYVVWDRTSLPLAHLVSYTGDSYFTPRSQQFFINEDRDGWWFAAWRQLREPDASWIDTPPAYWPTSLDSILNEAVETWLSRVRNRAPGTWPPKMSAVRINERVRLAFD